MGTIGKDFDYKIIDNFLSKDEIELLSIYCEIMHRTNLTKFDTDQINRDSSFYGDSIMESLMLKKKSILEKESGKKLLATYSYWRCYTKYAVLPKHKDRESCEISATVHINSNGPSWPIFINGNEVNLKKGDCVIYLGGKLAHWRDEFKGDHQFQAFLHYVDADGKNKDYYMDKRNFWGQPRTRT